MFSVIFEVHPKREQFDLYLGLAKNLRPVLEGIDGFIDNERFESKFRPGWILSHSTWRDEKSVVRWRTVAKHHETQQRGRDEVFRDYHLRVGEVVSDTTPPQGLPLVEQRLDETEVGGGKFATLTEVSPAPDAAESMAPSELAERLALNREHPALIDHDVFVSIYNAGKLALLASWRDRGSAEAFRPIPFEESGAVRHRVVRIVRDYGMFDRRESPQYYPDIERGPAT
jgi:heme-degrading monooxygenase HmoA